MRGNIVFLTGAAHFLQQSTNERRFLIIEGDEFLSDTGRVWASKTPDEIMADIARCMTNVPNWHELEPRYSGPPSVIPIPHREPELAPDEVPRVVAKARAVAIFGPKRGRWK